MKTFLVLFFSFLLSCCFSQEYPQDFGLPLTIALQPRGVFGALGYTHFDTGVTFASNKTGVPVYAVADGEVSRIKISTYGYGKVLFIKHSDGYTTLYGHLSAYADSIENLVKKEQYKQESYEVDLFPTLHSLRVKKGDLIGYTGTSGSEYVPNLYFECRETASDTAINPYFFGLALQIKDSQPPVVNALQISPLQKGTLINGSEAPFLLSITRQKDGSYLSQPVYTNGSIGFAVESYDPSESSYAKNGLYSLQQIVNGSTTFEMVFDRMTYEQATFVKNFIDYRNLQLNKQWFQKFYVAEGAVFEGLKKIKNNGIVTVAEQESSEVELVVKDFFGNTTKIHIPVYYKAYEEAKRTPSTVHTTIDYLRDYAFQEGNLYVDWSSRTFESDVNLELTLKNDTIFLHKNEFPVFKNINLRIDVAQKNVPLDKTFIGLVEKKGVRYFSTWKRGTDFRIRTQQLGTYALIVDEQAPTITPVQFQENQKLTKDDQLVFIVVDELSGLATYKATINGKWTLFSYDYKTKKISHKLSDGIAEQGNNKLQLVVTDFMGNNATFEMNFQLN